MDSNLNLPPDGPDQRVVKVLSAPKSQNNLCGVGILFRSVENAEIETNPHAPLKACKLQRGSERFPVLWETAMSQSYL